MNRKQMENHQALGYEGHQEWDLKSNVRRLLHAHANDIDFSIAQLPANQQLAS